LLKKKNSQIFFNKKKIAKYYGKNIDYRSIPKKKIEYYRRKRTK